MAGTQNLKRGGITREAQEKGRAQTAANRLRDKTIVDTAGEDPYAAYVEMHKLMTKNILELLKKEAKEGTQTEVTNRLREYRQLTDSLSEYLERKGTADSARQLFAALEARLAQANLDERSPAGPPDTA